jgi:hypothetical protein
VAIVSLTLLIRFLEIRDGNKLKLEQDGIGDTEAPSTTGTDSDKSADGAILDALKGDSITIMK